MGHGGEFLSWEGFKVMILGYLGYLGYLGVFLFGEWQQEYVIGSEWGRVWFGQSVSTYLQQNYKGLANEESQAMLGVGDLFWKFIFHWIGPENDSIQNSIQSKIQNIHSKNFHSIE